ncbi:DUF29 domain-containing protein [Spirulina subsalsa]|uniref:DUF29 domain-containing protein n=1 Tax=Spirulina subsalsa TaxID=54311 RepID=UPI0002E8E2D0|nr:DUF29 domain-containing protein [Spirulina subsalsa]
MESPVKAKSLGLYDRDYQLWLERTVAQLKAEDFNSLDLENLIEEIESLGRSEKRAIASYLMRLCEHLLKIKYWESEQETCFRGWNLEVTTFRFQIQAILQDSPSLKNHLRASFLAEYNKARTLFIKASQLHANLIPQEPEFTLEQALDEDWLPWRPQ